MKLSDWFNQPNPDGTRRLKGDFAAKIGVTPQIISAYCKGRSWPGRDRMAEIIRHTNGDVTANDFLPEAENAA